MPPTQHHDTGTVNEPWDAGAEQGKIPNDATASTLHKMYAWKDPKGNADTKSAYKLPHHKVVNGQPGPANVNGVRAALSRAGQQNTQIPSSDVPTIRANLLKHLAAAKKNGHYDGSEIEADEDFPLLVPEDAAAATMMVCIAGRYWCLEESRLVAIAQLDGRVLSQSTVDQALAAHRAASGPRVAAGVSVVPLKGIITPSANLFSMLMGGGSGLDRFLSDLRAAVQDSETKAVVLDVDSPGGLVDMVPETAAAMREIRDASDKPMVAVANPLAASAAYWLASQAHEVVVTPSGEAGSIGVYQIHREGSKMFDRVGIKHTLVSAGKYKGEGNPYEALGDEGLASIQQGVNDFYSMFTADVAKGRGVSQQEVTDGMGEGRTLTAKRAKGAGLVDRVATLNETISRLGSGRAKVARLEPREAAEWTPEQRLRLLDTLAS